MKNKVKLTCFMILVSCFLLTGFTSDTKKVLKFLQKIKIQDVKKCEFVVDRHDVEVDKNIDGMELKSLVKLLNKSKSVEESVFAASKGGFIGMKLYLKSNKVIYLLNDTNSFWVTYGGGPYLIPLQQYNSFFNSIYKKYTAEFNPKKINDFVKYKDKIITKIDIYSNEPDENSPMSIIDKDKIDQFMVYVDKYTVSKTTENITMNPELKFYRTIFYSDNEKIMDITFSPEILINGKYYLVEKSSLDDSIFKSILGAFK